MVVVGTNEDVDDSHHCNSILKVLENNLGNQVVEKMGPPRQNCSVFPDGGEEVVQQRTLIIVR